MPEQRTLKRARKAKQQGKSPSTQAGEFVRETIRHIRQGAHGARSTKQAIAIGLSKARRAGVKLPPPRKGVVPEETRNQAKREMARSRRNGNTRPSARRSRATLRALRRESREAASPAALARHAHQSAMKKSTAERRAAARKAAQTRMAAAWKDSYENQRNSDSRSSVRQSRDYADPGRSKNEGVGRGHAASV